jgi:hypothetical protein
MVKQLHHLNQNAIYIYLTYDEMDMPDRVHKRNSLFILTLEYKLITSEAET